MIVGPEPPPSLAMRDPLRTGSLTFDESRQLVAAGLKRRCQNFSLAVSAIAGLLQFVVGASVVALWTAQSR